MDNKGTEHLSVGRIGEQIAAQFLKKKGFKIVDQNVNRKWGELDIVAKRKIKGIWRYHIVEVKTVGTSVACAQMHPAENLTKHKLEKVKRTSILYCMENNIENWQLDAVLVWYDKHTNTAQVEHIECIS